MKPFKERLLALVDNTASQARDMIGGFSSMVNNIDWDSHFATASEFMRERKQILTEKANDLLKEFSDLVKQVKDNLTDFSVTVAFDETVGEKLNYEVKSIDGISVLEVEVSYNDDVTTRSNKTTVKIPQNCDLTNIVKTVNKNAKTATITIPKAIVEPKTEEVEKKEEEKPAVKVTKKARKKAPKAEPKQEENNEQEKAHAASKLAEKLRQNVERAKLMRDTRGRFVRREV